MFNRFKGLAAAAGLALAASLPAGAQTPGLPTLQNAFANPGLAFAANFGTSSGQSFFGAAAAWGLGGGRLVLSGAAGVQRLNEATRGAYGARVATSAWTSAGGSLGVGAFVGFGGAARTKNESSVETNPATLIVPAGVSIGYRRPIGATRGFSIYAAPMYRWTRAESNGVAASTGNIAGSVGLDFAISQSFGATVGGEFGKESGGGSSSTLGVAVSFVPGRRS